MTANSFDWDTELPPETGEEVYRALRRALERKQGFGLFFVQCSRAQGEQIVADLRRDLPQQRIEEMHLTGEVTTLYDPIADRWQQQPFDVLIIDGLEASLYAYEDVKRLSGWSSGEIYNYSWKGVPKILNHLNQQREHLRNDFPARFIFLVPSFVVDYFIQRAADFLDWRSGLFRFPRDPREVTEAADRFVAGSNYSQYLKLTSQERVEKILTLKEVFQETNPESDHRKGDLLYELGLLFAADDDYENAIISWEKVLQIKPDYHYAWVLRGLVLFGLGREEEAIASYDRALEIKPNYHHALIGRGDALSELGRKEEAIATYDRTIEIKPDFYEVWNNRGLALSNLGRYEEAIQSYDKALEIKPDYENAYYNKACCYGLQEKVGLAIETLQQAIAFDPKKRELAKTDPDFDRIRNDERFQALVGE